MKKQILFTGILSLFLIVGISNTADAQFGKKATNALGFGKKGKNKAKSKSGKGGSFSSFNAETDPLGITGEYFGLVDTRAFGFRFVKESEGKIVDELHYYEKKGDDPQLKLQMKESYYRKNQVKLFLF